MGDVSAGDGARVDFEALYRQEHRRIQAMCLAILGDRGEAEDVAQEAFARMAQRLDGLDGDPAAYLVVVARNLCRAELRRRALRRGHVEDRRFDPTPEDTAVQRGMLGQVWRQLARVEQTLLAYVFCGMTMAEIGERTGASPDLAAQRVSRLRRRIRRMVATPAVLLWPVLKGSAMGRLALRSRAGAALARMVPAEHVIGPVLLSIAAGIATSPALAPSPAAAGRGHAASAPSPPVAAGEMGRSLSLPAAVPSLPAALPRPLPSAAGSAVHTVLPPPADVGFLAFTPAPHYASDHIVFASTDSSGCTSAPCPTLMRSDDGGATWKPLTTQSFGTTFRVLLPPDFPADPTIFGTGGNALYRSDDGGMDFALVVTNPDGLAAAVDPTSQPGNTRIFLDDMSTSGKPLVFTEADGRVRPLTGLPPATTGTQLFTAPGASAVYFDVDEAGLSESLYACPATASTCSRVGAGGRASALSPTFDVDHTYFDPTGNGSLVISTLAGGAVGTVPIPGAQTLTVLPAADYASSRVVDLVVSTTQGTTTGVRVVGDTPRPWALAILPGMNPATITRLPDGRLLAGLRRGQVRGSAAFTGSGTLCSADDGASWSPAC